MIYRYTCEKRGIFFCKNLLVFNIEIFFYNLSFLFWFYIGKRFFLIRISRILVYIYIFFLRGCAVHVSINNTFSLSFIEVLMLFRTGSSPLFTREGLFSCKTTLAEAKHSNRLRSTIISTMVSIFVVFFFLL